MAKSNLQVPVHPESFQDLEFPSRGIDLSQEVSAQIPGTTPLGQNVRWNEPLTQNARGGSRSGLSKYIPGFVNTTGASKIQNLDSVVIVDSSALGGGDSGGGGFQPVKNSTRTKTPFWRNRTKNILGVQKKIAAFPPAVPPFSLAFDNPVVAGNEIIAAGVIFPNFAGLGGDTITMTATRGSLSQVNFCPVEMIFLWYGRVTSSGVCTISMDVTGGPDMGGGAFFASIAILEYSGMAALPLTANIVNDDSGGLLNNGDPFSPGTVSVTTANSRVIAVYTSNYGTPAWTALAAGLTRQLKVDGVDAADVALAVFDGTYSASVGPSATYNGIPVFGNGAIGASFKKA